MRNLSFRVCIVTCLLLILSLAACGGGDKPATESATSSTAAATSVPAEAVATKVSAAATAVQPTAAAAAESADESLSLKSRADGLDKLTSYRARWVSEWSGTEGDKEVTVNWDWTEEYTRSPEALHFTFVSTSSEEPSEQGTVEIWQIGSTAYMMMGEAGGEQQCIAISSEEQKEQFERGLFNPSSLGALNDARYVGMEEVNGIRARHYKYDEKAAGMAGFSKLEGEIWVAVDGGYVVKDTVRWEGSAGFLGTGATGVDKGQGQWTWELSDVNQPLSIEPPANCESAAGDLPLLADAAEKTTFGDMVAYKTAATIADVVKFYQEQMSAAGWQAGDEPMITDTFAQLGFTKDGQTVQIMITSEDDKTQVMITVQK